MVEKTFCDNLWRFYLQGFYSQGKRRRKRKTGRKGKSIRNLIVNVINEWICLSIFIFLASLYRISFLALILLLRKKKSIFYDITYFSLATSIACDLFANIRMRDIDQFKQQRKRNINANDIIF